MNLLELVHLTDFPLALCNDGTQATYYRNQLNDDTDTKKLLIYLNGGGMCVPYTEGYLNLTCQEISKKKLFWLLEVCSKSA